MPEIAHQLSLATAAPEALPRVVGRYELLVELASGGMATVYLGRAIEGKSRGRIVAIKCCHPHLQREEEFATMFLDEAHIAARIRHPNVVATLDASERGAESLYMVMEFVDGYSLWQLLRAMSQRGERIPAGIVRRILIDALCGLHAAHELRDARGQSLHLVHRDVSPQNILVGVDGVARIVDFGIAKAESRLTITREGRIKGKLAYMAPEQHGIGLEDVGHTLTRRTDIYAAGVVLWEALTGQRLFAGDTDADTVKQLVRGKVNAPSAIVSGIGQDVDRVVMRALDQRPEERFATAFEFARALESCHSKPASAAVCGTFVRDTLKREAAERALVLDKLRELVRSPEISRLVDRAPRSDESPSLRPPAFSLSKPLMDSPTQPFGLTARTHRPLSLFSVLLIFLAFGSVFSIRSIKLPVLRFPEQPAVRMIRPIAPPQTPSLDVNTPAVVPPAIVPDLAVLPLAPPQTPSPRTSHRHSHHHAD